MLLSLLPVLLSLLLPSLALAQVPPPLTWSMPATGCQPADWTAKRLWRVAREYITVLPSVLTAPRAGFWPYTVRCPVPGDGVRLLNQLDVVAYDPDGLGGGARLVVEVRRHRFLPDAPRYPPFSEVLGTLDTSRHRPVPGPRDPTAVGQLYQRPVAGSPADFGQDTYSVVLQLARTTLAVLPPRVYTVRLGFVPWPPIE